MFQLKVNFFFTNAAFDTTVDLNYKVLVLDFTHTDVTDLKMEVLDLEFGVIQLNLSSAFSVCPSICPIPAHNLRMKSCREPKIDN